MEKLTADQSAFVYFKAIVFNLIAQLFMGIIIACLSDLGEWKPTLQLAFMAVLQLAFFMAVRSSVVLCGRVTGYGIAPVKWWVIALALVCAPACVLAFVFPANMFQVLLENLGYASQTSIDLSNNINICLATFVTVILAPVCEEYVFRGALLGGLVKRRGVIVSCLMSAAAFALMHMNPEQTVYQFCLGFVAAYLTVCSRSILPSIVLHGGNNLIAILLQVFR
ncbi:MAG: lysostaphin resistance A-like protein [Christensenellales bacterium]